MNKYGDVAVNAVQFIISGTKEHPLTAWKGAASAILGEGTWASIKGCPKNAFLCLCEEGLIKAKGNFVEKRGSQKNKAYAIHAVELLKNKPALSVDKMGLWTEVLCGREMSYNSQMDVVLALWNNQLIVSGQTR